MGKLSRDQPSLREIIQRHDGRAGRGEVLQRVPAHCVIGRPPNRLIECFANLAYDIAQVRREE